MSLDVSLVAVAPETPCIACDGSGLAADGEELYEANITHNLARMAREAGIYLHLWRPEELGFDRAEQLVEPLQKGLDLLLSSPGRFRKHNPENGWGDYEGFVSWVRRYLEACREYPNARLEVSR